METPAQAQVFWAAQFETTAENGIIRLPADYPELANAPLRVLVLSAEPTKAQAEAADKARHQARLARLRATQAKLVAANPFRSIADPVQWQRDLRDEEERPLPGRP